MELPTSNAPLIVKHEFFRSTLSSWDTLFAEAAEFASQISRERLIGISHSADDGQGVVAVWYWAEPAS